jgi:hypothetical protein
MIAGDETKKRMFLMYKDSSGFPWIICANHNMLCPGMVQKNRGLLIIVRGLKFSIEGILF